MRQPPSVWREAMGPSRQQSFPAARTWPLDDRRQLIANLNTAGVVTSLELGFIPKPQVPQAVEVMN